MSWTQAVYIAYQEARGRLSEQKQNRGFFPAKGAMKGKNFGRANDIQALKSKSRCRRCGQLGHWQRECPKGKGHGSADHGSSSEKGMPHRQRAHFAVEQLESKEGGENGSQFPENTSFFVVNEHVDDYEESSSSGSAVSRGEHRVKGLSQCNGDGWYGFPSHDLRDSPCLRPSESVLFVSQDGAPAANRVTLPGLHADMMACVDAGCTKSLIGQATLDRLSHHLMQRGVRVQRKKGQCNFRFGGDFSFVSQDVALIPCCLGRHLCCLSAFVVPGETPLLLSLPLLQEWQSVIDLKGQKLHIERWGLELPLERHKGHIFLDLWHGLDATICRDLQRAPVTRVAECAVYFQISPSCLGCGSVRVEQSQRIYHSHSLPSDGRKDGQSKSGRTKNGSGPGTTTRCQDGPSSLLARGNTRNSGHTSVGSAADGDEEEEEEEQRGQCCHCPRERAAIDGVYSTTGQDRSSRFVSSMEQSGSSVDGVLSPGGVCSQPGPDRRAAGDHLGQVQRQEDGYTSSGS